MTRGSEDLPALSIKTPAELVQMLKTDVTAFNKWRAANPNVIIIMQGVNFSGCNLRYADLHGAFLESANFKGADLYSADLTDAKLNGAKNFSRASLFYIKADALTRDTITSAIMAELFAMKATWQ